MSEKITFNLFTLLITHKKHTKTVYVRTDRDDIIQTVLFIFTWLSDFFVVSILCVNIL